MTLAQTVPIPQHPPSPAAGLVSGITVRTLRTYQVSQTSADPATIDCCLYSSLGFTTAATAGGKF